MPGLVSKAAAEMALTLITGIGGLASAAGDKRARMEAIETMLTGSLVMGLAMREDVAKANWEPAQKYAVLDRVFVYKSAIELLAILKADLNGDAEEMIKKLQGMISETTEGPLGVK